MEQAQQAQCTQEDLMQALQTLLHEKKKVKNLEQKLEAFQKGGDIANSGIASSRIASKEMRPPKPTVQVSPYVFENESAKQEIQTYKQEVHELKSALRDLSEKVKSQTEAPVQAPQPTPVTPVQTKQAPLDSSKTDLWQAQNEIKTVKEQNRALEDEISRLKSFRAALQSELKEQSIKATEGERLRDELAKKNSRLFELEKDLQEVSENRSSLQKNLESFRNQVGQLVEKEKELQEKVNTSAVPQALLEEKRIHKELLEKERDLFREEIKELKRLLRKAEDDFETKEYEYKKLSNQIQILHNEKEELRIKTLGQDSLYGELIRERDDQVQNYAQLLHSLQQEQLSKKSLQEKLILSQEQIASIEQSLQKLKIEHERKLQDFEELDRKNAALSHEISSLEKVNFLRDKTIEDVTKDLSMKMEEASKAKHQVLELESQIAQLEQHLTRRVKECAYLTKAQEEQVAEIGALQTKIVEQQKKISELTELAVSYETKQRDALDKLQAQKSVFDAEMLKKEQEYQILYESWQAQSYHLNELKKTEEKFVKLTDLFGQVGKIVSQPAQLDIPQPYDFRSQMEPKPQPVQKPFFIPQETRQPPVAPRTYDRSMFEPFQ